MLRVFCTFAIFIISFSNLFSHTSSSITGYIHNIDNEPIQRATIKLLETKFGVIADKQGNFTLKNIPFGDYQILITAIGYDEYLQEITLKHEDKSTLILDILMKDKINYLDNIIVTGEKTDKIYQDVPIRTSVLDDRIFLSTQSSSIKDGIRFQPGLRVEANCQNCGESQVRLNGLEGMYSQILIDGRPIFSDFNSIYGLEQIPTNMIDRIEVVRGGGSILNNGKAIGGVINVITKTPQENKFNLSFRQGFMNMESPDRTLQLSSSIVSDNLNSGAFIFGNIRNRSAWDYNDDGFSESPLITEHSIGAQGFIELYKNSRVSLSFMNLEEYRRGGDNIDLPPHEVMMAEDLTHSIYIGGANFEHYFNDNDSKISLYTSVNLTSRKDYDGVNKDPNGYGNTNDNTYVAGAQFSHIAHDFLIGSSIITLGTEWWQEELKNIAEGYRNSLFQTTKLISFYLQNDWELTEDFSFLAGLRLDKHNLIENSIIYPRFTMMYLPIEDLTLRGNFTTGYRAPQAYEADIHTSLRSGARVITILDSNLTTEHSIGYSFSADYTMYFDTNPITLSLEYFNTTLSDIFINEFEGIDEKGNNVFLKSNGEGAVINGITAELLADINDIFELKAGITYQKSKYTQPLLWSSNTEKDITEADYTTNYLRTPNFYGYLTLYIEASEDINFNITGIYTDKMYVPHFRGGILPNGTILDNDLIVRTPSFFELNLQGEIKLLNEPNLSLNIGVINLLNQFQLDFDRGASRDTDYIYGPMQPLSASIGIKLAL